MIVQAKIDANSRDGRKWATQQRLKQRLQKEKDSREALQLAINLAQQEKQDKEQQF